MMKLHEIINVMENHKDKSVSVENILKYKNSLITYYKDQFFGDPFLMVTDVFNAVQYARIVDEFDLGDAVEEWIGNSDVEAGTSLSGWAAQEILFNSKSLLEL